MLSQAAWVSTLTDRLALFPFGLTLQLALTRDLTDLSESYTGDSAGKSSVAAYDSFRGAALTRPSAATLSVSSVYAHAPVRPSRRARVRRRVRRVRRVRSWWLCAYARVHNCVLVPAGTFTLTLGRNSIPLQDIAEGPGSQHNEAMRFLPWPVPT